MASTTKDIAPVAPAPDRRNLDPMKPAKYTEAELAAIAAEVAHEDEIEALREADEWESDYSSDPSGQS